MKLNAVRSNNQSTDGRDASIQKIAQMYLPDDRKEFSPEYLKRKKIQVIAGFSILGLLIFSLIAFILSSHRVQVAITVTKMSKESQQAREKAIINDYKLRVGLLNPAIARGHLVSNCSPLSRIEGNRVLLVTNTGGDTAIATVNFNKPMDFTNGYFLLDARSLNNAGRIRIVLNDDNKHSNARSSKPVIIQKKTMQTESILIRPSSNNSMARLDKISQIRFELAPLYPTKNAQTSILIEDFTYLTKPQISED